TLNVPPAGIRQRSFAMSQPTKNNDGKLLFAIAGGIIVIAAGIAILTSLGDRGAPVSQDITAMPAVRTDVVDSVVFPASIGSAFTDPTASLADQVKDVDPVEPVFVIDPAANFVKQGIAAYESKRYDQAQAYFAAEAEARPGRAWTHYILALSQWKSGRTEDAADSMRRSLEIDATQVKALVNLSRIENDRDEFDAALTAADEALVLEPENAEAVFLVAPSVEAAGQQIADTRRRAAEVGRDPEDIRFFQGLSFVIGDCSADVLTLAHLYDAIVEAATTGSGSLEALWYRFDAYVAATPGPAASRSSGLE
ncbi:MAG: LLM class flavin-dependent oxidoreductase, partial [Planctomycetes bacterium]|nr:LLM class flavin-dependent oxidoreductase [Planctomycetota bacterium]